MDILFDLDGTLTDSAPGITRCLEHALVALGRRSPPLDDLRRHIGLPLWRVLADLLATDEHAVVEAAVAHYRERFSAVGLYENAPYADVADGLATLRRAGHRLWVVTSKPEVYARKIVEHFALASLFEDVYGSELSGDNTEKVTLVTHAITAAHLDPTKVWTVGDRAEDVRGGRANGTRTAGVLWGYGSEQELVQAAPDVVVGSMAELTAALTGRPDV
jgi:phosphoglycolate phosphatase